MGRLWKNIAQKQKNQHMQSICFQYFSLSLQRFLYLLQREPQVSAMKALLSNCRAQLLLSKEVQNHSIENRLMVQLKMDITKTDNNVPAPQKGDDGEAVSKIKQHEAFESENELKMPDDAGWYVAVVRCNCENTIGKTLELYFQKYKIWFEYWVPMQRMVVIDKRSGKRRVKEKVLLTTFIFCHVSHSQLDTIRFRSDVYKMLTMPGHRDIYRLRDKEVEAYRRLVENPDLPITPCSGPLRKGQRVRITEGTMAGLEAYVQRISGKKAIIGNEIKYVSGATIEIDRNFLETISDI